MAAVVRARLSRGIMGRLRLASQLLVSPGVVSQSAVGARRGTVPQAVRWMTAMQAQDLSAALWAVGQRVPGARLGDVRGALDRGEIVRSWPMRGTLHLLAPEDLKWILVITSERLIRGMAGRHRELDIAAADVDAAREAAVRLVSGGGAATRAELFEAFERAAQPTAGQRGIHLLGTLCQRGSLVLGPLDGNQQRVVAFDEWITQSRQLGRKEGIAELLLRYLRSHGPATERDFAWWSGVPLTEVRAALGGLTGGLVELEFEGTRYWLSPETAALLDGAVPGGRSVLLLPGFDEFLLGYADRSLVLPAEHSDKIVPGGNGVFRKTIVTAGEVTGTWTLVRRGKAAGVVPEPFDAGIGLRPAARKSFELQAAKYLKFLGADRA